MADQKNSPRKPNKIVLVPPDPTWKDRFQAEARRLASVLGAELVSIEHAGSTAIPGIKAKPTIDFLVIVHKIERIELYNNRLAALGYEVRGENGIQGRRFFTKTTAGQRRHNVHVFQAGHPEIERMLDFRDYLRAHPAEAKAYSRLKESLAHQYPNDIQSYSEGKSKFILEIIRRANAWRGQLAR